MILIRTFQPRPGMALVSRTPSPLPCALAACLTLPQDAAWPVGQLVLGGRLGRGKGKFPLVLHVHHHVLPIDRAQQQLPRESLSVLSSKWHATTLRGSGSAGPWCPPGYIRWQDSNGQEDRRQSEHRKTDGPCIAGMIPQFGHVAQDRREHQKD